MFDFGRQKVLVISPHQDDLEVGCGGIVQKFIQAGSSVCVAHGTWVDLEGTYRKFNKVTTEYMTYTGADRLAETKAALDLLGGVTMLEPLFDSGRHHRIDTVSLSERIATLEKVVAQVTPTTVLIAAVSSNQDHEALNRAARSMMRPHYYDGNVLEYEVGDELAFVPNLYVPLTEAELEKKLDAFALYKTQQSGPLHMISLCGVRSKSEYRGKQCYQPHAEAFNALRLVL